MANPPVRTTPSSPQVLPPPEKGSRLVWTKEMDQAYIGSLFAAHYDGKRVEPGGFKDEAWVACCAAVQQVYKEYRILKPQVKNRLVWWRSNYKNWKFVSDTSGMGWDYTTKLFDADDSVWGPLLSAHPRLKGFRFHPTLYVEEMETLFDGRMASGDEAAGVSRLASQITRDDECRVDPPGYRQSAEGTGFSNIDDPIDPELTLDQPQPPTQPPTQPQTQPHTQLQTAQTPQTRKRAASRAVPQPHQTKKERSGGMAQELVKAVAGMNRESELIREMMQRELESQEPWQKRAFRQIRTEYPGVAKLITAYKTVRVLRYLAKEDSLGMSRGELLLLLEGEERVSALKDTMDHVGIIVKSKPDGTIYGELKEDELSFEDFEEDEASTEASAEEDEPAC